MTGPFVPEAAPLNRTAAYPHRRLYCAAGKPPKLWGPVCRDCWSSGAPRCCMPAGGPFTMRLDQQPYSRLGSRILLPTRTMTLFLLTVKGLAPPAATATAKRAGGSLPGDDLSPGFGRSTRTADAWPNRVLPLRQLRRPGSRSRARLLKAD